LSLVLQMNPRAPQAFEDLAPKRRGLVHGAPNSDKEPAMAASEWLESDDFKAREFEACSVAIERGLAELPDAAEGEAADPAGVVMIRDALMSGASVLRSMSA
jgi:hypothetical protein